MSCMGSRTPFLLHSSHRKEVCKIHVCPAPRHTQGVWHLRPSQLAAGTTPAARPRGQEGHSSFPRPTCALGSLGSLRCPAMLSLHSAPRRLRLSCHLLSRDCHCIPDHPGPRMYPRATASVFRSVWQPGA